MCRGGSETTGCTSPCKLLTTIEGYQLNTGTDNIADRYCCEGACERVTTH